MQHSEKGDLAEALAEDLLLQRGYAVRNLNQTRRNAPVVDLEVEGVSAPFLSRSNPAGRQTGSCGWGRRPVWLKCLTQPL